VIHHIPEADMVFREIGRLLKPGGTFCVAVYNKSSAFHIFSKIIHDGLRKGKLFTLGYSGLLSTVERGADGISIKPYVRLYTKSCLGKLLKKAGFGIQSIGAAHLKKSHLSIFRHILWPACKNYERFFGWFVYAIARKE
jgi:SAM-dependent methyltransferase